MFRKKSDEKLTEREQVALRREEVLSRGRKFKYPLQYAKHRIAIIAAIISVVALIVVGLLTYASLYVFGSTNEILLRVTQAIPIPVAEVSGENVPFSDYLLLYRSSIAVVDKNSEEYEEISAEYKRSSLDSAEQYAYAKKLSKEINIAVSDEEIAELFNAHVNAGGTERKEENFLKILSDNFGMSKSEYNHLLELLLIKMKVSAAIDDRATSLRDQAAELAKSSGDLSAVADKLGEAVSYEDTGGLIGVDNIDGGRSTLAFSMEKGQISEPFISTSGDCYYIVKLLEKTDNEVSYASIKIPFTEFDRRFIELIENGDYQEFISLQNEENNVE